jgi:hypothetical protein
VIDSKQYDFGGKVYEQRPIVLGQLRLLIPIISTLDLQQGESAVVDLVRALGDNLHRVMAIVLIEPSLRVREAMQQLDERQAELEWSMHPESCIEVLEDFFECNRVSSLFEKIKEATSKAMAQGKKKTSLNAPPSVLPVETSAEETPFYGEDPQRSPSNG